jgi:hypothetical protein
MWIVQHGQSTTACMDAFASVGWGCLLELLRAVKHALMNGSEHCRRLFALLLQCQPGRLH